MCSGNISKDFSANNIKKKKKKKKTGLDGSLYEFFAYYIFIDDSNIIDIHKYLMKKHDIKWCLDF